jgi:hypothetical protein
MIHPDQMQRTMEHEDFDFLLDGVAKFGGLAGGSVRGNSDLAKKRPTAGWKGEYVCGDILSQELTIQFAQARVPGKQAIELAAAGKFAFQPLVKAAEPFSVDACRTALV